jgi:hypothetical protein
MYELTRISEIQRVPPDGTAATTWTLAAGTSAVNSGEVDLQASNAYAWFIGLGAVVGSGTFSAQVEHSDTSGSGFAAITGKVGAINGGSADSNKVIAIDVNEPTKRYHRLAITRGTANSTIDYVMAVKFRRAQPVTQGATVETAVI